MMRGNVLAELAEQVVRSGVAPHCALGFSVRRARVRSAARALASERWSSGEGGAVTTLFDLASVTKPMLAVAVAVSGIEKETPLGALVPELADTASGPVALEHLLAHRAGLTAHIPLYTKQFGEAKSGAAWRVAALREAAMARRPGLLGNAPFDPLYSDMGYALVGYALARSLREVDAGAAIERLVVAPLERPLTDAQEGSGDANHNTPFALGTVRTLGQRDYAPTEVVPDRGGEIRGAVHDENAWALTGAGGSGHAGMFGNIGGVLAFGRAVLDACVPAPGATGSAFAGRDLSWLWRERAGGTLRAGFDGKSVEGSSAGSMIGPHAFGHLGFTGTSLWIDPDAEVVIALLTNRVHPTRDSQKIRTARPQVHDALFTLACDARTRSAALHK
jgi:serine-type D-Ala-D-Ala carboxypeptidase